MPLKVDSRLKNKIEFLYRASDLGPQEILTELEKEYGQKCISRATIVRELRKFRLEREREFGLISEEGALGITSTKVDFRVTGKKRRKTAKPLAWTVGEKDFSDEDTAIISQILTKAATYDVTIPGKTSRALARWIVRLYKAYPHYPAIIIWYAAYEAELIEFLQVDQKIKADYRHIDRTLQFQPWKGKREESLYEETCDKERIGWDRNWWKSHKELFQKAESSVTND